MGAIDKKWEFSDAESVSGSGFSVNSVDLGNLGISYPQIGNLFLNAVLSTAFTSLTSIDVILQTGTAAAGGDGNDLSAAVVEVVSRLCTVDLDVDGTVLCSLSVPMWVVKRHVQVLYTLVSASGTAVIDCWMGLHPINQFVNIQEAPA